MWDDSKYKIEIKVCNKKGKECPNPVKVYISNVARPFKESDEKFAEFLGDYMNGYWNEYKKGQEIGKSLQSQHRTLQGSVIRLLLGILVGIGDTEYFDERNEKGVAVGKKLKDMIEKGELNFGYMI